MKNSKHIYVFVACALVMSMLSVYFQTFFFVIATVLAIICLRIEISGYKRRDYQRIFKIIEIILLTINWRICKERYNNHILIISAVSLWYLELVVLRYITRIVRKQRIKTKFLFVGCAGVLLSLVIGISEAWTNFKASCEAKEAVRESLLRIDEIEVESPLTVNLEECSLKNSIPVIAQIINEELSVSNKQDIALAISYVEMRCFGCKPVEVQIGDYEASYYDFKESRIYISQNENIEDYEDFIKCVLHLCYHVLQVKKVEILQRLRTIDEDYTKLITFEDAKHWETELKRYKECNGENDMCRDANKYVTNCYYEYIRAIKNYWDQNTYQCWKLENGKRGGQKWMKCILFKKQREVLA